MKKKTKFRKLRPEDCPNQFFADLINPIIKMLGQTPICVRYEGKHVGFIYKERIQEFVFCPKSDYSEGFLTVDCLSEIVDKIAILNAEKGG